MKTMLSIGLVPLILLLAQHN
uniref:Uncharacterized protein n=1 Tax=Rhizophora mucronata TaxID=61149 RepID=A0A2P2IIV1_RHIMU